jgi:hypothetical protein
MPTLKPYPAYRQTDLPWLGQIPVHWEIKRLKSVADLKSGDGITADDIEDERLNQTIRVNTSENAMLTFKQVLQDMFHEMLETNFKFYQNMDNNPDFAERLTKLLFERYRNTLGTEGI